MKLVLRILNLVLAALAGVAFILLFAIPAFSFNSKVVVDVKEISKFIPETTYTKDIDVVDTLGTDEIQVGVKFKLSATEINKVMNGDKDIINNRVIIKNIDDTLQTLDDAVDVLADNTIRKTLQTTIKDLVKQHIESNKKDTEKSADELMDLLGLDDDYFKNFSNALYDEANKDGATTDSVGAILQEQVDDAILKAEKSNAIKPGSFTQEQKDSIKASFVNILNQLEMVKSDGKSLEKIGDLPYMYITKYVKQQLDGKVAAAELEKKEGETNRVHSDRLIETLVINMIPDLVYQIIGYVSLGMFIGMFIFAGTWILLAAFELLHFFFVTKKHRLFKGLFLPFFMLSGLLQIVFGFVLTGVCKFVLPEKLDIASFNLPIKDAIIVPRTCTLASSIVFIIVVGVGLAYFILKKFVPKDQPKVEG